VSDLFGHIFLLQLKRKRQMSERVRSFLEEQDTIQRSFQALKTS
jgi:hypothetical protein